MRGSQVVYLICTFWNFRSLLEIIKLLANCGVFSLFADTQRTTSNSTVVEPRWYWPLLTGTAQATAYDRPFEVSSHSVPIPFNRAQVLTIQNWKYTHVYRFYITTMIALWESHNPFDRYSTHTSGASACVSMLSYEKVKIWIRHLDLFTLYLWLVDFSFKM